MRLEFVDLKRQYRELESEIETRIKRVMNHTQFIQGPEVAELEQCLAEHVGVKHCIGCASGTDALLMALMVANLKPGDEVITSPFSFIATAEVIALLGATPVFVDIDEKTFNIAPKQIKAAITDRTKAIIPVSLYGQCADLDPINEIAKRYGIAVIEDAAQSFGATYKGRKSCALTSIACTSFFPSKPLACYGDGGACFTDDDEVADRLRWIRTHGQDRRYHHVVLGINGRLDTLQAAILLAKFSVFPKELEARTRVASAYDAVLAGAVVTPYIEPFNASAYAQYTVQVENRDGVQKKLASEGIPTAVHYPVPLHHQPAMKNGSVVRGSVRNSEKAAERVLSLPMHPYLSKSEIETVADSVKRAVEVCV